MGVAQKPRSWPRWVNFTPALVGHFYIGGDSKPFMVREAKCLELQGANLDADQSE